MLATTLPPVLRDPMFPEISTFGDASGMWFSNFWWPMVEPLVQNANLRVSGIHRRPPSPTAAGFTDFYHLQYQGYLKWQRFGSPKCMRGMVLVSGSPPAWKFLLTSPPSTLPKAKDCVCDFSAAFLEALERKKQIQLEELKFRLKTMMKPWVSLPRI